jgi:hypothetical protein
MTAEKTKRQDGRKMNKVVLRIQSREQMMRELLKKKMKKFLTE